MPRRNWIAPLLTQLRGTDSRAVSTVFQSLTSYLRGHIGFWGFFSGTTDANGHLIVTHNCGFDPDSVQITAKFVTGSTPHDMGPFHVHDLTEEIVDIHFLKKSGNDSANEIHAGYYLILPKVKER
jgi:hypothetical protein